MAGFGGTWQQKPPLNHEAGLLKFLLPLLLISNIAAAQEFDLRTLPPDYSFVSIEKEARVTMNFMAREGDIYFFEETIETFDGEKKTAYLHINRASQALYWQLGDNERRFSPHDCGPSLGLCTYAWTDADGTINMRSETRIVGDIWLSNTFYKSGDEWVFWSRDCTIYDDFGFWIDFVRLYDDGETFFGYRERSAENRIDDLWQICDQPAYIS